MRQGQFPAVVRLADLNGQNGFVLDGENNGDNSGSSVSTAGDINGDGYADLLIGAPNYGNMTGRSYVIFGAANVGSGGVISLSSLNGANGFKLDGENNNDYSGGCVSRVGDLNADGYDDLVIGAPGYPENNYKGRSYVVFGGPKVGGSGKIALLDLNGVNGFKLNGENNNDHSGGAVRGVGDVNGDGHDDLIISSFEYLGGSNKGRSYVLFGGSGVGSSGVIPLSTLNGVNGFKLDGENNGDDSGHSVSGSGDINGDGYADLIIGADYYPGGSNKGRSYVVFGGPGTESGGILALSSLNGVNGFKLDGENNGDLSGKSISVAGDINGDGVSDLLIGADGYPGGGNKGRSYVVFGDIPPVLVNNQLYSTVGGATRLNATYLSAYDLNHNNNTLLFIPGSVVHGRFESSNNPGVPLANFTQQRIRDGEIQFVHDGTLMAPSYNIAVNSGGIANINSTLAKIIFTGVQPSVFPAVVQLSSLNGKTGFKIDGEMSGDHSGQSVSITGDINGDDCDDFIIGAPYYGNAAGRSYVVFGSPNVVDLGIITLSSLNGTLGFKLDGSGGAGVSVSSIDINGDSYSDLIIGANEFSNGPGRTYVVFGNSGIGQEGLLSLTNLNGVNGFKLQGEVNGDISGQAVNGVRDINGDGYDDLLIGAPYHASNVGRSYVVFGGHNVNQSSVLLLGNLNGANGFKLDGETSGDASGAAVAAAGDINDDGYDDLLIGAPYRANRLGRSYVVFGKINLGSNGLIPLSNLNGENGFKLDGENAGDISGYSLGGCIPGDVNGDGISDLIIGAGGYNSSTGRGYVIFGDPGIGANGLLPLSSLNGANGFKIDGEAISDGAGYMPTNLAGDFNGDGYTDLVIGSYGHNNKMGRIYLIFGGPEVGKSGLISLADLNGINGIKFDGEAIGDFGSSNTPLGSVSALGDVNSDGISDLLIGAAGHNGNTGRSYVVFGDVAPQFMVGPLTIHQNQAIILNSQNLNATDFNHPAASLRFNVTQVQHGYFSLVNSTDQAITSFNQSQIWNGQIQFIHDGSQQASNYTVQVQSDGLALPPPSQPANISFYRRPALLQNSLLVHQGETLRVTANDLNVTDDYPSDQVMYTISGLQYGQFQLAPAIPVSQFSEQQLLAGQIVFVQDDSANVPNYQVIVSDPYFTLSADPVTLTFYRRPVIVNNQLVIHQGESIAMTPGFLNVTDDYSDSQVIFTISNLQHGQFQLMPANTTVTQFTAEQLWAGQVRFAQDNSTGAPDYQVGVSDPYFTLPPTSSVTTTFYRRPTITTNQLLINQGEAVVMTPAQLSVMDDYPPDQVIFTVSEVQHGQFQLLPLNTSLTQFSEQQLAAEQVIFAQDGGNSTSNYQVGMSDPYFSLPSTSATIIFYRQPGITTNQLLIHQGEAVVMTASQLSAMDDYPPDQVIFTVSQVQHGQFQLLPLNTTITQFNEQQLEARQIIFTQEGSASAPDYQISLSDPYFSLPPSKVKTTFYRRPVITTNQLPIHQGETVIMTSSLLSVVDDYPSDEVIFMIAQIQHGQFQLLPLNTSLTQFTEQQLLAQQVVFVQDGGTNTPSYEVGIRDPYFTLPPAKVNTTFYRKPVITTNQLLINQGQTVVMSLSQLNGIDDYPSSQVIFIADQIQHGQFQLLPPNTTVRQFTKAQLMAGEILFVQDNSAEAPGYQMGMSDPYFNLPPTSSVTTTFYRRPSFIHNQLRILEGETVLITANELSLQDDYPDSQILFIISECQHGQFELIPAKNMSTIQFTQQQVNTGQIQFVHDNAPTAPSYQVMANDGYFTMGPMSSAINFTLVDKPPFLVQPIPPETFAIGQAFNFKIAADTFSDEQGKPISLSSALADDSPLPEDVTFDPPSATFTGLVNSPADYNISVTGTSVAELATTTFFMLKISGQSAASPLIDMKTLASIAGSIVGIGLTILSFLYTKYHFRNKRDFEHPFANALHQRLNLSYLDFFDKDGKEYATLVDRMMALVKIKNGVDIETLQDLQNPDDKALYNRYADIFAVVITKQVKTNSVYCGLSRELHLRGLNSKCEQIVDEVIRQISQPDDEKNAPLKHSSWCSLFCCRRLSSFRQSTEVAESKVPHSRSASLRLTAVNSGLNMPNQDPLTVPLLNQ